MLRNTITQYVVVFARMITSFFTIYMLFHGLGENDYGFYSLLWEFFGFAIILDFGFGMAVQKYTAEASATRDYPRLNRRLSAIIGSYLVLMLIIIGVTYYLSTILGDIFKIENQTKLYLYKQVFLIIGIGSALNFPVSVFSEVLDGLKRYDLSNYIKITNIFLTLAGIYVIIYYMNHSILVLAVYIVILNFITNLAMFLVSKFLMPQLRIMLKYLTWSNLKDVFHFSFYVYIISMATRIINNTDRIVLGVMLGMAPVALYQIGIKIPAIMHQLTSQYQSTLTPVVASLHAGDEEERLRKVMFISNKLTAFVITGCVFIFIFLTRDILKVWLDVVNEDIIMITYIFLIGTYFEVLFRSVFSRYLLMADYHRILALIIIFEAVANLGISIFLIWKIGILGVVLGTCIPNFICGIFIIFPLACRGLKTSMSTYIFKVFLPIALIAVPAMALMLAIIYYFPMDQFIAMVPETLHMEKWGERIFGLIYIGITAAIGGSVFFVMGMFLYITRRERHEMLQMMPGFIRSATMKYKFIRKLFQAETI